MLHYTPHVMIQIDKQLWPTTACAKTIAMKYIYKERKIILGMLRMSLKYTPKHLNPSQHLRPSNEYIN